MNPTVHRTLSLLQLLLAVTCAGCVKSPAQIRHESFLATNEPGVLGVPTAPRRGIRPDTRMHVRVYADEGYRSKTLGWQGVARRRVEALSTYLRDHFHVRLECDSVAPWAYTVPSTGPLEASVDRIRGLDAGDGADWVIVFVGPAETERRAFLGSSMRASRFLFVRPGAVLTDVQSADELRNIDRSELDSLIKERAHHREAIFLLRAWAYSLGVPTDADFGHILGPEYDLHSAEFSAASRKVIEIGLQYRGDWTPQGRRAWGEAVLATIAANPGAYGPNAEVEVRTWMVEKP